MLVRVRDSDGSTELSTLPDLPSHRSLIASSRALKSRTKSSYKVYSPLSVYKRCTLSATSVKTLRQTMRRLCRNSTDRNGSNRMSATRASRGALPFDDDPFPSSNPRRKNNCIRRSQDSSLPVGESSGRRNNRSSSKRYSRIARVPRRSRGQFLERLARVLQAPWLHVRVVQRVVPIDRMHNVCRRMRFSWRSEAGSMRSRVSARQRRREKTTAGEEKGKEGGERKEE